MKKIMTLLFLFSIVSLGYAQNISMVTYHPSKYGNYDVLDTVGDTTLASETSGSSVDFSNVTSPYDVNVIRTDTTTVSANFLVGNVGNTTDIDVAETLTLSDTLDIEGNLTLTAAGSRNILFEDFVVRGAGSVTGTFNVVDNFVTTDINTVTNGDFDALRGRNFVVDVLKITSGVTTWTFPETGPGIVISKDDELKWDTIQYYPSGSTTTTYLTLLVLEQ